MTSPPILVATPKRSTLGRVVWWAAFIPRLFAALMTFALVGGGLSEAFHDGVDLSGWAFCVAALAAWMVSPFRIIHPWLRARRWMKRREAVAAYHAQRVAREAAFRRNQANTDAAWQQYWDDHRQPVGPAGYADDEPV